MREKMPIGISRCAPRSEAVSRGCVLVHGPTLALTLTRVSVPDCSTRAALAAQHVHQPRSGRSTHRERDHRRARRARRPRQRRGRPGEPRRVRAGRELRPAPDAVGGRPARFGGRGPAGRRLGQRDGDPAGAGQLRRPALPRRHRAERARRRDARPAPHGQDPARRPAQPHGRHRAGRHLPAAPSGAGRGGHARHAAALPAREQVRGREPARAPADADPALQLPPARAAAQLRRRVGQRRRHVHRRGRDGAAVARGPVAGRPRAGRPQGTRPDRLLPPADRRSGHLRRRDVGGGALRAAPRRARVPVRGRRRARRPGRLHLPARPHPARRRGPHPQRRLPCAAAQPRRVRPWTPRRSPRGRSSWGSAAGSTSPPSASRSRRRTRSPWPASSA